MKATTAYIAHYHFYRAWYEAVDQGGRKPDEPAAQRYFAFIEKAYRVLRRAAANYQTTIYLIGANRNLLDVAKLNFDLAELMTLLNQPADLPTVEVADPNEIINANDELMEIAEELQSAVTGNGVDFAPFDQRLAASAKLRVESGTDAPSNSTQSNLASAGAADEPRRAKA